MEMTEVLNILLNKVLKNLDDTEKESAPDPLTGIVSRSVDFKGRRYNRCVRIVLGFYIYAAYLKKDQVLDFDVENFNKDYCNDFIEGSASDLSLLYGIFESFKDTIASYNDVSALVKAQNLDKYRSEDNDIILDEWCVENLFFQSEEGMLLNDTSELFLLMNNVKNKAFNYSDLLDNPQCRALVSGCDFPIIKWIFKERKKASICFYIHEYIYWDIRILASYSTLYANYECMLKKNKKDTSDASDQPAGRRAIFPYDKEESFDFIMLGLFGHNDCKISDLMYFLKPGGQAIAIGLSAKKAYLNEDFYNYQIPFLVIYNYIGDNLAIVCKKEEDKNGAMFVAECDFYELYGMTLNEDDCINVINTGNGNFYMQCLSKDDFKYYKGDAIKFHKIRRKEHQQDYIWKDKSEVLIPVFSKECLHEDIDLSRIVDRNVLFDIRHYEYQLPDKYYLSAPECGYLGENEYVDEFGVDLQKYFRDVKMEGIPCKYVPQMRAILKLEGELTDEIKQFDAKVCCRLLTMPVWITDGSMTRLIHVSASADRPVCYRDFKFSCDEYRQLGVYKSIIPVTVADDYDPDYIAYILPDCKESHFLVPATKELQHKAYLKAKSQDEERLKKEIEANLERLGIKNVQEDFKHMLGAPLDYMSTLIGLLKKTVPKCLSDNQIENPKIESNLGNLDEIFKHISNIVDFTGKDLEHETFCVNDVDIVPFLASYCRMWTSYYASSFKFEFDKGNVAECILPLDQSKVRVLLDALHSNAYRHGFRKKSYPEKQKMKLWIDVVEYIGSRYLLVSAANNGIPLPQDFTIEDYITRGRFDSETGHTGLGGNHVYQIAKKHGGFVSIERNKDDWSVVFEILFPITSCKMSNNENIRNYEPEKIV